MAEFIGQAAQLPLDRRVRTALHTGFVDTVGVILAGRDEPVSRTVAQVYGAASAPQARVLFNADRVAARDAALINATAGHALDYDDVGLMGHPSVVLVPALLAEGERLHASGERVLRAYVVGYEVWAELIQRDQDRHHVKGWHPTAVFGVLAVAAAVAALRELGTERSQHALGIAASLAGGLIANFGSMTKPFHAGRASASGIDAVNLAEAGMTASPDALEHKAGFLAAVSPNGRVDREPCATPMGSRLRIATLGLSVKKYPMCFATHRVIEGMQDLLHAHAFDAQQVREVHVTLGTTQAAMLRNHRPQTALEAKFSLQFAVAAPLVVGRIGLGELDDAFVLRPEVQACFDKVRIETVDTVCPSEPTLALSDRVRITLADGRLLDSGEIFQARGGMDAPMSEAELRQKFDDCVAGVPSLDAGALFGALWQLGDVADVASLMDWLPAA